MAIAEFNPDLISGAKIKVIGVGWAGNNAVNRMVAEGMTGVEFVAINTDAQDLAKSLSSTKVNIGMNITKWLGAGTDPEMWRKAAEESSDAIKQMLDGSDMVFVTCGLGGGTGTGAAPVIATMAKEMGILTIWVVTKPFSFEGKKRFTNCEDGIKKMKDAVDTLIVIPNDKIFSLVDKKTTFKQAFTMIDKILFLWVQGISDLIMKPGDINIDFADIRTIMRDSGNALLGIGYGAGEKRATDAARKAIENPLLEANLDGAKNVIFAVTGGNDLTPIEVQEAAAIVEELCDPDVNLIWGMTLDESYDDEVKVTVIATGFTSYEENTSLKKPQRDDLGRRLGGSQDFISRSLWGSNTGRPTQQEPEQVQEEQEDYETPAFLRKKI
jgi:cell division protein FtsZ